MILPLFFIFEYAVLIYGHCACCQSESQDSGVLVRPKVTRARAKAKAAISAGSAATSSAAVKAPLKRRKKRPRSATAEEAEAAALARAAKEREAVERSAAAEERKRRRTTGQETPTVTNPTHASAAQASTRTVPSVAASAFESLAHSAAVTADDSPFPKQYGRSPGRSPVGARGRTPVISPGMVVGSCLHTVYGIDHVT